MTYTDSLTYIHLYILSTNSYNCQMQESWSSGNKDKGNESYKGTYCQSYLRNSGSYSCMIADEAEIKEPPIL